MSSLLRLVALVGALASSLAFAAAASATVPGANGQVLFPRVNNLWAIAPNFGAQTQLSTIRGRENGQWSSDGRRIALASAGPTVGGVKDRNIFVMNADGSGLREFRMDGVSDHPRWSPDDRQIVFQHKVSAIDRELFVMRSDGTGVTQITNDPAMSVLGVTEWSPDGTRIAFVGLPANGRSGLYTIAPDGTDRRLVKSDAVASYVLRDWSPDGAWLLAHRRVITSTGPGELDTDLQVDLVRITPDGSTEELVFSHGSSEFLTRGTWAPDGTTIIFTVHRDPNLGAPARG
ncbi:MAG: TolB family protein, partial [Gaiellaceae bacterium]